MQSSNTESKNVTVESTEETSLRVQKANLWATFKEHGFRGVLKKHGWKVVAGVFLYYLIRDTILYLVIPFLIAKGIF